MYEPSKKWENNAIFNKNCTKKLIMAFEMVLSSCFSLRGNLDFLQKCFITLTTRKILMAATNLSSRLSFVNSVRACRRRRYLMHSMLLQVIQEKNSSQNVITQNREFFDV